MKLEKHIRELQPLLKLSFIADQTGLHYNTVKRAFDGEQIHERCYKQLRDFIDNLPNATN